MIRMLLELLSVNSKYTPLMRSKIMFGDINLTMSEREIEDLLWDWSVPTDIIDNVMAQKEIKRKEKSDRKIGENPVNEVPDEHVPRSEAPMRVACDHTQWSV